MTTTERMQDGSVAHVRENAPNSSEPQSEGWRETKPFSKTSEFWMAIVGIAAVLIAAYVADGDVFKPTQAWTLVTVIASAYIVSRGLARSGTGYGSTAK